MTNSQLPTLGIGHWELVIPAEFARRVRE